MFLEFANAEHLLKHDSEIAIDTEVWCYGYKYRKVDKERYENDASIIYRCPFTHLPRRDFKPGVRKAVIRNPFGQILRY